MWSDLLKYVGLVVVIVDMLGLVVSWWMIWRLVCEIVILGSVEGCWVVRMMLMLGVCLCVRRV